MTITVKIMRRMANGQTTLYASREISVLPLSIGRDSSCTIVLEDPNKHISRFHVEVEELSGIYWMVVVSKVNPVMVKGRRYGPATRLTLSSGDMFEIAEYEVQVLLPEVVEESLPPPAPASAKPLQASSDPLVKELMATTDPGFADASGDDAERLFNESTFLGNDDAERLFNESTFVGGDQPAPPRPPAAKLIPAEGTPVDETYVPARPPAPVAPARPPAPSVSPSPLASPAALRAFLEGAGLPLKELSAADGEQLMRDSGVILRTAVEGIMMLLIARAEMRKEFEAEDRTMVASRDNNPLKLMSDPHEAMDFLFKPAERTGGFLEPVQAVGDALEDLRAHELALMAGMRAAIHGVLRRFDPATLERALDKDAKGFSLASRKARLWDLLVAHHEKVARDAQEDFNKAFGRDFMAAYQAQMRRVKGGL